MGYPGASYVLVDGTAVVAVINNQNQTYAWSVKPASGDTVRVRYKVTENGDWETYGSYTAYHSDHLVMPVYALEFARTAGSGTTSVCEVV